jgi:hypothetical protein
MPAFAPLLSPLFKDGVSFVLESPSPVAVDVLPFVLAGEPNPTVVGTARAVGNTMNKGLSAPFPAVVLGLRLKLQLETPFQTSGMSCEPL